MKIAPPSFLIGTPQGAPGNTNRDAADWEKHGRSVIERVRRDDPSAYLRVMASVVRPASEPEAEDPFAQMTVEELKAELLAGLASLFPELRVVAVQGQALIARTRDR